MAIADGSLMQFLQNTRAPEGFGFRVYGFDVTNSVQYAACYHFSNLQPMWWINNIQKSNAYDPERFQNYMTWFVETKLSVYV